MSASPQANSQWFGVAAQSEFAVTSLRPGLSVNSSRLDRAELYAHFGLTDAQARLADLLHDIYASVSDRAVVGERYNEFFETKTQARMAHVILSIARYGANARIAAFPGERPTKARPRRKGRRDSIFERVKGAVRIEELAGRFTELKSAGVGKLRGLCPVHDERTASFYVNEERQTWHCFGACASGGDVIALVQRLMDKGLR